jgi:RNase P/RNase MRP subunit POP5
MAKLKPLLPSLKERKRYIVYKLTTDEPIAVNVPNAVTKRIEDELGVYDAADAGIIHLDYDERRQEGIIRCRHDMVDKVRTALTMQRDVDNTQILPQIKTVSGTLKNAQEALV